MVSKRKFKSIIFFIIFMIFSRGLLLFTNHLYLPYFLLKYRNVYYLLFSSTVYVYLIQKYCIQCWIITSTNLMASSNYVRYANIGTLTVRLFLPLSYILLKFYQVLSPSSKWKPIMWKIIKLTAYPAWKGWKLHFFSEIQWAS